MSRSLQHERDVTLDLVRNLLALLLEQDLVAILHASLHVDIEDLILADQFGASALRALLCEHFALATAGSAGLLHLHLHHAHLDVLRGLALSLAGRAGFEVAALSATAATLLAVDVASDGHLALSAVVQLLEGGLDGDLGVGTLAPVVAATAPMRDYALTAP